MQTVVSQLFEIPVEKVAVIMIHLAKAKEREPKILALHQATQTSFEIFHAIDGNIAVEDGHPTKCGMEKDLVRTAGEVGCLLSHVEVARQALARGLEAVVVFEDDCEPGPDCKIINLYGWLNSVLTFFKSFSWPGSKDLILLGTGGTYDFVPLTQFFKGTRRFNCTHAYLIRRPMMKRLVDTYEMIKKRGQIVPIDGLFGLMLQAEKKFAIAPARDDMFFKQDRTLPSYVVGNGTTLRTG
jgi:hypothetical protein